ncbi:hypothetical protein R5R35_013099 [Gryllus longicercus]|uniref:Transcription initiation factor IIF subunit alpha n=1 Tax=Gryllus longicercus TaxID=2509291 RepID=A0AAN9YVA2_9ORTH
MASSSHPPGTTVQEFSIRVPKNAKKTYKVMRFNSSVNVDFQKWSQVKMERENNLKEFRGNDEDQPRYGAGSEFGREAREEARRKKYGIVSKKYRAEDQPWILKVGGKTGKKFKGTREGGVAENAAYYVFTHAPDGAIEAYPLQEWYNFQPTQRYKALSAEEAEQEFGRRNKQVNYFSLMMRKRLRGENEEETEEGEETKVKGKAKGKKGDLKISEMDDWDDSSESTESEEENKEQDQEKKEKDKKKNKETNAKKKKKRDPDDEAFEESDDGDEEGREVDYISDSSESASDHETKATKELKGVEEEDALRKLLSSGEEDEEEEEKQKEEEKDEEPEEKTKGDLPILMNEENDKKSKKKTKDASINSHKKKKTDNNASNSQPQNPDSSSEMSSDSTDSDNEQKKKNGGKTIKETSSAASSRSATPTKDKDLLPGAPGESRKRKAAPILDFSANKKNPLDNFATAVVPPLIGTGESGISEDAVRRYLMRKPMTTTELLQKFKTKKTGLTSEQLVNIMTQILKRINPVKQTIKGKMYLSIKAEGPSR